MTQAPPPSAVEPHPELFPHGADIGVRGVGPTRASAFEQAALALTSAVTDPTGIAPRRTVEITCEAPDDAFLLLDWLNTLIYEMAVRRLVFGRFAVSTATGSARSSASISPTGRAVQAGAISCWG